MQGSDAVDGFPREQRIPAAREVDELAPDMGHERCFADVRPVAVEFHADRAAGGCTPNP